MWVTSKTNRPPSFCLILKLSHAHLKVCSVYIAVYIIWAAVININALFAEWSITEHDYFQILFLGILSSMELFVFRYRYRCCDSHFPFHVGKYIFPQLQTCTALVLYFDCTEGSCSYNIVILNNLLIFNFPFFNFEQLFPFPWRSISSSFLMLYSTIN